MGVGVGVGVMMGGPKRNKTDTIQVKSGAQENKCY